MEKGRLIGQGRTSEIFEYGENKVLKLFRLCFPKDAIENEYNVGLELSKKGLPVAGVDCIVELDERFGIVFERINGQTMMNLLSSKPWTIVKEAQKFAELHKEIQIQIMVNIPCQKTRLKQFIKETELLNDKTKTNLFEMIMKLPEGNVLCHGDFHPDNIIISNNKFVVIDWMTATIGNPLSDVARTSIIFKFGVVSEHKSRIEKNIIDFLRGKFYFEYIKHYLKITGESLEVIEQWEIAHAAARLIECIPLEEKVKLLNFVNAHFD